MKPIAFLRLNTRRGKPKPATLKVLLDSGASESVLDAKWTKNLRIKTAASSHKWSTPSGGMTTNKTAKTQFTIPELQDDKLIEWDWHVMNNLGYDAIIGRDILEFLGIDLYFSTQTVQWGEKSMSFKDGDCKVHEAYYVDEPAQVVDASNRLKRILDAN